MPATTTLVDERPRRRTYPAGVSPLPNLHFWMIIAAMTVFVVAMIGHAIRPQDEFFMMSGYIALGAMFGKFSNGFGARGSIFIPHAHVDDGGDDAEQDQPPAQ